MNRSKHHWRRLGWGLVFCSLFVVQLNPERARAAAASISLRFAIADPAKNPVSKLQELVAPFEAAHPNIKIQFEPEYAENLDKLTTHMIGGEAADIIEGYNALPLLGIQKGFFLDLMPYIRRDEQESLLKDFVPATIASFSDKGRVYGFPQLSAIGAVYYNTQMFARAGLAAPSPKWDWNAFGAAAKRLTMAGADGKIQQAGYQQYAAWLWTFPWLEAAGADFTDPKVLPLNTEPVRNAVQYLHDLKQQGSLNWGSGLTFLGLKAAMTSSGSWEFNYWANARLPMGITSMPTGPAGKVTLTNTNMIGINRYTKHPEEAWEFLKWFYTRPVQERYLELFAQQPARLSLGLRWVNTLRDFLKANQYAAVPGLETFITDSAYARPQPFFANPAVITQYVQPALNDIMQREKPLGPTLEAAANAGTAFLRQQPQ